MVETNLLPGPPPNCIPSPCPPNSEWYNLGYIASAGPAVSALVGDVPRIFFVDQGGTLKQFMYTKSPGAQWPTWGSAVPIANAPVGLTEIAAGQVDPASFMICGITGDQYKCSPPIAVAQPWPTSAWTTLPGSYGSRPAVSTWLGYFPQVFGHSSFDSQLWDTISFLGWNNPVTQGGDIAGAPAAAGMNVGGTYMGTYVFAKAGWDNSIWYNIETRSGWMTWFPLN
jgi:hypothetical protein